MGIFKKKKPQPAPTPAPAPAPVPASGTAYATGPIRPPGGGVVTGQGRPHGVATGPAMPPTGTAVITGRPQPTVQQHSRYPQQHPQKGATPQNPGYSHQQQYQQQHQRQNQAQQEYAPSREQHQQQQHQQQQQYNPSMQYHQQEYASADPSYSTSPPQEQQQQQQQQVLSTPQYHNEEEEEAVTNLPVGDESLATIEVTRELVKKFISDIWNRGEIELIPHVCHPSLRFNGHVGMDRVGHEGFSRMVTTVREALTDYHCGIHSMVVETNKAFCRLKFTGKHTGNLLGYPPTGKTVVWMGASEFTCKNGKIYKVWELGDVKSLEDQLKNSE